MEISPKAEATQRRGWRSLFLVSMLAKKITSIILKKSHSVMTPQSITSEPPQTWRLWGSVILSITTQGQRHQWAENQLTWALAQELKDREEQLMVGFILSWPDTEHQLMLPVITLGWFLRFPSKTKNSIKPNSPRTSLSVPSLKPHFQSGELTKTRFTWLTKTYHLTTTISTTIWERTISLKEMLEPPKTTGEITLGWAPATLTQIRDPTWPPGECPQMPQGARAASWWGWRATTRDTALRMKWTWEWHWMTSMQRSTRRRCWNKVELPKWAGR